MSFWLVRKPYIYGIKPVCAVTIWFTNTPLPGSFCDGLCMNTILFPFVCQVRLWAFTNWHATQSGGLFRHSISCLVRKPPFSEQKRMPKGRCYSQWCELIYSCWIGDNALGLSKYCASSSERPVPTLFLSSSGVWACSKIGLIKYLEVDVIDIELCAVFETYCVQ